MEHLGFKKKEKLTEIALCCFEMAECIMLNQDIFDAKTIFLSEIEETRQKIPQCGWLH